MIKFVDLKTGNLFNGDKPYVFWFPEQQSTDIIYSHKICFVSTEEYVDIKLENNKIFSLIDQNKLDKKLSDLKYVDINELKCVSGNYQSIGYKHHNYYVHIVYLLASTNIRGEYIEELCIGGDSYNIGADFYTSDESLHINLSNNGIEIPNQIQKAMFDSNVREDKFDNILLNRKWKELLSNYWDIIANKGSYKSLVNSLKWFEYGDMLRIKELRKRNDDKVTYLFKDLQTVMESKYTDYIDDYIKTTYLSISLALKQITNELDDEKNPLLKKYSYKWSIEDMSLKMSLLGNFYKTYFMPIHLDLIHSTIEDVVFSNNFKEIVGGFINRHDFIFNTKDFYCSVNENSVYRIGNIETFVYPNTIFKTTKEDVDNEGELNIVGVQTYHSNMTIDDDDLNIYISQLYKGVGVVVPFKINIPLTENDFIKRSVLIFNTYDKNGKKKILTRIDNSILRGEFEFNLLCTQDKPYSVSLEFDTASGKIFTKTINFNVLNSENCHINIYKVQNKTPEPEDLMNDINIYSVGRQMTNPNKNNTSIFKQYIYVNKSNIKSPNYKGVKLNRLIVVEYDKNKIQNEIENYFKKYVSQLDLSKYDGEDRSQILLQLDEIKADCVEAADELVNDYNGLISSKLESLNNNFFKYIKNVSNEKSYDIFISKEFGYDEEIDSLKLNIHRTSINMLYVNFTYPEINCPITVFDIYRDDYIFVPGFHYLVELGWESINGIEKLEYYTINDYDTICVVPEISFGKYIEDFEWEFKNISTGKSIILPHSIKEPFILNDEPNPLTPGYYTIIFNYRLVDGQINKVMLNSAFRKI